jgi:hypothetical protein
MIPRLLLAALLELLRRPFRGAKINPVRHRGDSVAEYDTATGSRNAT